jgi:hypothetical protein
VTVVSSCSCCAMHVVLRGEEVTRELRDRHELFVRLNPTNDPTSVTKGIHDSFRPGSRRNYKTWKRNTLRRRRRSFPRRSAVSKLLVRHQSLFNAPRRSSWCDRLSRATLHPPSCAAPTFRPPRCRCFRTVGRQEIQGCGQVEAGPALHGAHWRIDGEEVHSRRVSRLRSGVFRSRQRRCGRRW